MIKRLLTTDSRLSTANDTVLNVFVTEDKITVRHLIPTEENANIELDLFSHTLIERSNFMPNLNREYGILNYLNKNFKLVYQDSLTLDKLKNIWKAGQVCLICAPSIKKIAYTSPNLCEVNLYPSTYTSKVSLNTYTNSLLTFTDMGAFLRFFPLASKNFLTSNLQLYCFAPENLITNLEFTATCDKEDITSLNNFYNSVNTFVEIKGNSTIKANSTEILKIEVLHENVLLTEPLTFKIECVDGYAPHTRVNIVDGKGQFKVNALGLEPGEQMRIKINDGFYTSKAEHTFTVI